MTSFADKRAALVRELEAGRGERVALAKDTSNLFRDRAPAARRRLDVRQFDSVLAVDPAAGWVDVEGMTRYETLVDATLAAGVMPCVVPQLKSITIGGAVAGVGIEASSFRYGLVHETVLELEIVCGDGQVVVATEDNEHRDLFYGFPNSYGTLGYALRVKARTVPVKRYVQITHQRHDDARDYFPDLALRCASDADFVDGVVFSHDEMYITQGRFVDQAPQPSDYTFERMYYRSIRDKSIDYLSARDFLWRWDTDWFWCSKNLGAQNPLIRRLLGRERLNSTFYAKVMRWNSRVGATRLLDHVRRLHRESVIQDVDIPIENAARFLDFFQREIGITPVWICPIRSLQRDTPFALYPMDPRRAYVNFGFWDVVRTRSTWPAGHFNRLIEQQVSELGGIKSLYSDSYYTPEEFWRLYNRPVYDALKARYDPRGVFGDLYQKCVMRN